MYNRILKISWEIFMHNSSFKYNFLESNCHSLPKKSLGTCYDLNVCVLPKFIC